jgi:hypothetical protein
MSGAHHALQPTPVGVGSSAFAGCVAGPAWLTYIGSFGKRMMHLDKPVLFLATANAEQSRAFYEGLLGLAFVADEPPALVFQVG